MDDLTEEQIEKLKQIVKELSEELIIKNLQESDLMAPDDKLFDEESNNE